MGEWYFPAVQPDELEVRIVVWGAAGVGKTSIIAAYQEGRESFREEYRPSYGPNLLYTKRPLAGIKLVVNMWGELHNAMLTQPDTRTLTLRKQTRSLARDFLRTRGCGTKQQRSACLGST